MPQHAPPEATADPGQPAGDTRQKLTLTSVALHWLVALGMLSLIAVGLTLDQMERGDAKTALLDLHKSFGTLILVLVLARIWWRSRQGPLVPLSDHPRWQEIAAKALHHVLLLATIVMPLSGMLRTIARARPIDMFGYPFIPQLLAEKNETLAAIGSLTHEIVAYALLVVVAVHVGAALKHHFFDRDGTLRRMLGARIA